MRVETVDEAVLKTLAGDALRPAVVNAVIDGVLRELEPQRAARDVDRLRSELQTVDREVANLTRAIAAGGHLEPLLAELKVRQDRCQQLRARLAAWAAVSPARFNRRTVEAKIHAHLERWRGLLTKHVEDGRQFFREALTGPVRFAPEGRTYRFEGELALGRLLGVAGLVAPLDSSPMGIDTLWQAPFSGEMAA
jgi:hypothetical protein